MKEDLKYEKVNEFKGISHRTDKVNDCFIEVVPFRIFQEYTYKDDKGNPITKIDYSEHIIKNLDCSLKEFEELDNFNKYRKLLRIIFETTCYTDASKLAEEIKRLHNDVYGFKPLLY